MMNASDTIHIPTSPVKMFPLVKDITGQKFGRLTVLHRAGSDKQRQAIFLCRCDCGNEKTVTGVYLRSGNTLSCGCLRREMACKRFSDKKIRETWKIGTHRKTGTAEYKAWCLMKARCFNPGASGFEYYGGRGITVCERWRDSFENFLADMGRKPTPSHSIERNDTNGNYESSNCRWATQVEQANNKSNNHIITHNGITMTMAQWAKHSGVNYFTFADRLRHGWSMDAATQPRSFSIQKALHPQTQDPSSTPLQSACFSTEDGKNSPPR